MSKTAPINEDVHALILDKQEELKRKYKITVRISDLIALYVRHSINITEKLLGFESKEKIDATNDIVQGDTSDNNVNDPKNTEPKT